MGFGFEEVAQEVPVSLTNKQVEFFVDLLGEENVFFGYVYASKAKLWKRDD